MKKILKQISAYAGLILIFASSALGQASNWHTFDNTEQGAGDKFGQTGGAIDAVLQLIMYLMYAAGGIMMGLSGFKLKQGDVPGFAKMFLGGAAVFVSPMVVRELVELAN